MDDERNTIMKKPTTVALFGVFDGIHDGHRAFIREARTHGDHVVVIVARDTSVEKIKGKLPLHAEADRIKMLLEVPDVDLVFLGDSDEGSYKVLKEINPEIVLVGYDQQSLFESITHAISDEILLPLKLVYGTPYQPDIFHSSLINTPDGSTN